MKISLYIILILSVILAGCKKNDSISTSGTQTIDNNLYGTGPYYANGFLFSLAKTVTTLDNPEPDITIDNDGTLFNLILQTNNFKNSFFKIGEYPDPASAEQTFNNLTAPVVSQWVVWADSLKANQVWIFKTASEHYVKLRIIGTISEPRNNRNYAECTFQWVYQPDGSLTFPGK